MQTQTTKLEKPEKPEKPLDSDCCGNGCSPCVWDHYYEQLNLWNEQQKEKSTKVVQA